MTVSLTILMITKNSDDLLKQSLSSVGSLTKDIIVIDDFSKDKTIPILKEFGSTVYQRHDDDLGAQRAYGLDKCKGEWVLMLDADEIISRELAQEIIRSVSLNSSVINGYYIPYQNHLFGKPINYGGENYSILRLFKRSHAVIGNNLVHEHISVKGKTGYFKNKIYHYSYRSPVQILHKFTDYAKREAKQKAALAEKASVSKLILYPLHMFWARFIKDKGYKDGFNRLFLDFAFSYMEFCTYFFLIFINRKK